MKLVHVGPEGFAGQKYYTIAPVEFLYERIGQKRLFVSGAVKCAVAAVTIYYLEAGM